MRRAPQRRRHRRAHRTLLTAVTVAASLTAGAYLASCKDEEGNSEESKSKPTSEDRKLLELSPDQVKNADLGTAKAGPAEIKPKVELQGDVIAEPDAVAKVASQVKGVISELKAEPGDEVKKGQVVAVIRSRELAEAAIGFLEAAEKVGFARQAYRREKKLWEKKISPKETYLEKKQAYSKARLAYKTSVQRLKAIGIDPGKVRSMSGRSRKELAFYEVTAPLAGTVTKRTVTKGQAVSDEAELMEIADLSHVLLEVPVPARYLPLLEKGQKVNIRSEKLKMESAGTLVFISPVVDQPTRTARARVQVANPEGKWRPGLCAAVKVPTEKIQATVTVPKEAVLEVGGEPAVFVVKKPTVFELRRVELGLRTEQRVQIKSGLSAGEVVATKNNVTLKSAWQQKGS